MNDDSHTALRGSHADAVALFRPKTPDKLKPFLDLDDESEESEGFYAEELEDGTMLVHTFQPFAVFEQNPSEAREWLAQFGEALPEVHDDPRGLLFFPDSCEPEGTTYDAVVEEVASGGIWIATSLVDDDDEDIAGGVSLAGLPPIDMETLQAFAGQLFGAAQGGPAEPATSYDVAKLFEGVQQHLLEALGMQDQLGAPSGGESGVEDEDEPGEDDPGASEPKPPR